MGENSKISWTHHTWNPWWGCHRVSPGCEHCYAETFAKRTGHAVWGRTAPRRFLRNPFAALVKMQHRAHHTGERHRVFIASMADIFEAHPEPEVRARQDAIRAELWALVPSLASLDLLLLTKRPQNVREMVPASWMADGFPRNIWLGTTCEDQQRADERIPHLLDCPAAVRWVSYEPALGTVNFEPGLTPRWKCNCTPGCRDGAEVSDSNGCPMCPRCGVKIGGEPRPGLDWIVVGGESGAGARRFNVQWARDTIEACAEAGVACFTKQMGANVVTRNDANRPDCLDEDPPGGQMHPDDVEENINGYREEHQGALVRLRLRDAKGGDPNEWPEDLRVRQYPGGSAMYRASHTKCRGGRYQCARHQGGVGTLMFGGVVAAAASQQPVTCQQVGTG